MEDGRGEMMMMMKGERGTECKKTKQRGKDKNVSRGHGGGKDNSSFV